MLISKGKKSLQLRDRQTRKVGRTVWHRSLCFAGLEAFAFRVVRTDSMFDTLNHAVRFIKLDKSSSKAISVTTVCGGKDDSRQIRFPDGIVFSEEEKCAIFLNDAGIGKISTSSSSAGKISPSTISPSTMLDDLKRMIGDKTLPQGRVTFVVGPERQRIEHISKNILCVRSEFFMKMFRARSVDVTDDEILLPSENFHAYVVFECKLKCDKNSNTNARTQVQGTDSISRHGQYERTEKF